MVPRNMRGAIVMVIGATLVAGCRGTSPQLEQRPSAEQALVRNLEEQRDDLRARVQGLEKERDDARERTAAVEKERDEAQARIAAVQKERETALARAQTLQQELDTARAQVGRSASNGTGASGSPQAPDRWEEEVLARMRTTLNTAGKYGYTLERFYTGRLTDDGIQTVALDVGSSRAKSYMIVGACDSDCRDLDLVLSEPNGQQVDQDVDPDAYPVVSVPAGHSGEHTLRISMPACSVNPCRYGYAIFSK
jgi:outer membrane murein-binding lipoprotein Lpp